MSETAEQVITEETIDEAMDYEEYRRMINVLLKQDKTTGTNHSPDMVEYTKMNVQRMKRLDRHTELSDELVDKLESVNKGLIWLILTEGWCGDAAQNVPALHKMAEQSDNIEDKYILRDQHLEIMDEYLTNGGRSIPKLICLDADTLEEVGTWGPRPEKAQEKAMEWKDDPEISKEEWAEKLHKWYADNKTQALQDEFIDLLDEWS